MSKSSFSEPHTMPTAIRTPVEVMSTTPRNAKRPASASSSWGSPGVIHGDLLVGPRSPALRGAEVAGRDGRDALRSRPVAVVAELVCHGRSRIDDAAAVEGTPVIDHRDRLPAIAQVADVHPGAERQGLVGNAHRIGVERDAAGRWAAGGSEAVPGGHAARAVAGRRGEHPITAVAGDAVPLGGTRRGGPEAQPARRQAASAIPPQANALRRTRWMGSTESIACAPHASAGGRGVAAPIRMPLRACRAQCT